MLKVLTIVMCNTMGKIRKRLKNLEALLIGKKEPEIVQSRAARISEAWRRTNEANCTADWKDA